MKSIKQKILFTACNIIVPVFFSLSSPAIAQTDAEVDRLFDRIAAKEPKLAGPHTALQYGGLWRYRHYPQQGTYVSLTEGQVIYVSGQAFGGLRYFGKAS